MKHVTVLLALVLAVATVIVFAQQQRPRPSGQYPAWEVKVLEPHEIAAGRYAHVRPYELDDLAADGWELVAVTNYVLRNEEHEGPKGERPMVTQAYQTYAFKRLRRDAIR